MPEEELYVFTRAEVERINRAINVVERNVKNSLDAVRPAGYHQRRGPIIGKTTEVLERGSFGSPFICEMRVWVPEYPDENEDEEKLGWKEAVPEELLKFQETGRIPSDLTPFIIGTQVVVDYINGRLTLIDIDCN